MVFALKGTCNFRPDVKNIIVYILDIGYWRLNIIIIIIIIGHYKTLENNIRN